jgi:uncharacterized protein
VTPQEEQLLNSLVERVNSTQLQEKDPDAEALLRKDLGSNPDALYILAQTVLVQNIALEQAKAQVAQLQQQAQQAQLPPPQPARATSFLGGLFGHHDTSAPQQQGYVAPAPPQQAYVPPPPPPAYGQPQYQQVQPQYAPVASAGPPSFLRGAMQTAAGVAAGALAFEGVESVLHGLGGFGHPGFGMGGYGMEPGVGMMGGGFERPVEETVVNNYYDQPGGGQGFEDRGDDRHFRESSDASQGAQFSDAGYNTSGDDRGNDDNSGFDDSSNYDNSGHDGGSGFDDGGGFGDGGSGGDDGGGVL